MATSAKGEPASAFIISRPVNALKRSSFIRVSGDNFASIGRSVWFRVFVHHALKYKPSKLPAQIKYADRVRETRAGRSRASGNIFARQTTMK